MTHLLPTKPQCPLDTDCCGQGCTPCILDLYEQEINIWKDECSRIQAGEEPLEQNHDLNGLTPVLSLTEYRSFTIEAIFPESQDTYRFRCTLPKGRSLGLTTGQHIVIKMDVNGEQVSRQYTPVSDIHTKSYFDLLIKVYETGKMSKYVKDWSVGTCIHARGPFGSLSYKPNMYSCVYMFAMGTGIAPMSQIIQTILNNGEDEARIDLQYGCRTYTDILMKSQLNEWARYWNFSCTYHLSKEIKSGTTIYKYGDIIKHGHIDSDSVTSLISKTTDNFVVFVCGTKAFERDMMFILLNMGISEHKIIKF